jgi:hypothetical protein
MSDPADKSDDLIAELAKLMAAAPGSDKPAAAPIAKAEPFDSAAAAPPTPPPVRIPGATPARPSTPSSSAAPSAPRAPVTGTIRIPGMDNPAPVSTSAPVSKFDFGAKPSAAAPIKQEPLSTLSERLAAKDPAAHEPSTPAASPSQSPPVRIPSDLKPVSENRSFAEGPALSVTPTPPAASPPLEP